jgi:anti-anti-sigma factor
VLEGVWPVRWMGREVVVALPEHIDVSNAGEIREGLLSVINRGATVLIADLTATVSCDYAGSDAVVRAYQRAVVSGTRVRMVVTAQTVRQMLSLNGLDRLVSIYPSLEAAVLGPDQAQANSQALRRRAARAIHERQLAGPSDQPEAPAISTAVLLRLIDALADAVALTDDDGVLVLVNRRLEDMFGYEHAELAGYPVETLIPADLRAAHRRDRGSYAKAPTARPMGAGARLVGLRKDGATFPVEVSLSPVPTATGHLTLAVIRDVTEARRHDLADLARAAVAAEYAHSGQELLNRITTSLFHVGLSLQTAIDVPVDVARQRIGEALQRLDDTILEIRDNVFTTRD